MGQRLSSVKNRTRFVRLKSGLAISPFTVFLLGLSLSYWLFHMFTIVTMVGCDYAMAWLEGWPYYWSPFQIIGLVIVLSAAVWLLRVLIPDKLNRIETVFQFVLIIGLFGAVLSQKAYFLPYAQPSRAVVERAVSLYRQEARLLEEADLIDYDVRSNWEFDYPPPPFAREPEWPGSRRELHAPMEEIFLSNDSPAYSDFQRLDVCYENYRNAVSNYQRDLQIWEDYWRGFSEKYPNSARRYQR